MKFLKDVSVAVAIVLVVVAKEDKKMMVRCFDTVSGLIYIKESGI